MREVQTRQFAIGVFAVGAVTLFLAASIAMIDFQSDIDRESGARPRLG